jgi:hypothetical protein
VAQLNACHHLLYQSCANQALNRSSTCPICRNIMEEPRGCRPTGTLPCEGYSVSSIILECNISGGIQNCFHDNPGVPFDSVNRTTYLPDTAEGLKPLASLEYAFLHGLTFCVGTSLTLGTSDVITWVSIHHKTSSSSGPHGFPDPNFLINCNAELDGLGVPQTKPCIDKRLSVAAKVDLYRGQI